ncbi:MAG: GspE/PulE family protein [bacterium]
MPDTNTPPAGKAISIAPKEVEQRFNKKMKELKLRELEQGLRDEAIRRGLGYINLAGMPIDQESLKVVSREAAEKLQIICFAKLKNEIRIAISNPDKDRLGNVFSEITNKYRLPIGLYLVSRKSLESALKYYNTLPKIITSISGVEVTQKDLDRFRSERTKLNDLADRINQTPLTEVLSFILAQATQSRATDVHIEAEEKDVKIRYRIDGVLHTVASLPRESWKKIVSRIKLLASLKLNIEDRPQDGRITLTLSNEKIDIRVSTVPTAFGESIAMRLLLSSESGYTFEELGLKGQPLEELKKQISRPNGMIVTTGPTGSGKTTTLYAILKMLNSPQTKIITLEDPIEYRIEGINQSQVNQAEGYNFVRGLKHALRQDPDIVMVGEIRDIETAEIAIQATLTGHLVLTTLHTNDAAGAIPRFLSIGVKPFLLAPSINAVVGQRLVRQLCETCKKPTQLDGETMNKIKEIIDKIPENSNYRLKPDQELVFYIGEGCDECSGLGYKGRIGIFEVLVMNQDLEKQILSGSVSEYEMRKIAYNQGMLTMAQDGILKALEGTTSIEEVFRVAE